jgi:hypothetical protein
MVQQCCAFYYIGGLKLVVNKLMMVLFDLNDKVLFNKTNICVRIIQMEETFVLREYGMESIGHQDPIPYGK